MPELPDVEGHRHLLAEHVAGRTVRGVSVPDAEILVGTTPQGLGRSLRGRQAGDPVRHGKWLWEPFDGPTLVFHFRMTGTLAFGADETPDPEAGDAVLLHLDDGTLRYRTSRRLGRVWWVASADDVADVTGTLGVDVTDMGADRLAELLGHKRGGLKSALMDQELIAGLGNELVDEILWRAKLHPKTSVGDLDRDAVGDLHRRLRQVLRDSIRAGHVPSGPTWLNGQRGSDDPVCPRCHAHLDVGQVSGRTTYRCPREQPGGAL
jgi:formamidopyrimidine-DNA glycosylase